MVSEVLIEESEEHGLSVSQDLLAGTCAGVAILLVGHPFDTLKVSIVFIIISIFSIEIVLGSITDSEAIISNEVQRGMACLCHNGAPRRGEKTLL